MEIGVRDYVASLGQRLKIRRLALGLTQKRAAEKAGVSYSSWRRMERDGKASIEDMVRAALVLRCEDGVRALFPEPVATSMDDLLERQRVADQIRRNQRKRKARF